MDFTYVFGQFYTKYRGEETPPTTTDPEWAIAVRNYNAALDRLEAYDNTKWDFMKTTLQASTQVSPVLDRTLTTGDSSFVAPTNMLYPGGLWWKVNTTGTRGVPYKVYKPEDISTLSQGSTYGYFLGDKENGFTFYLNPSVATGENGYALDYLYYKKLTRLDPDTEAGTTVVAPASSEFFACFMAAQRFFDSRNFPAYQVMKKDSETALAMMKLQNDGGEKYNPTTIQDTSAGWGV